MTLTDSYLRRLRIPHNWPDLGKVMLQDIHNSSYTPYFHSNNVLLNMETQKIKNKNKHGDSKTWKQTHNYFQDPCHRSLSLSFKIHATDQSLFLYIHPLIFTTLFAVYPFLPTLPLISLQITSKFNGVAAFLLFFFYRKENRQAKKLASSGTRPRNQVSCFQFWSAFFHAQHYPSVIQESLP